MRAGILVLSAHVPELSGLRAALGPELRARVGGLDVEAHAIGIGLVAAARGTASVLFGSEPRAVVFVGTCGAYPARGIAVGEVVVAERIGLVSTAAAEARAAFPAPMRTRAQLSEPLADALAKSGDAGARCVAIATTLAITTDDALAARTAEGGDYDVEHLEAFAVADACAEANVAFGAVLGVANRVGSTARAEWLQNHRAAGDRAGSLIARWLERGAPGV
jgi:purine-nucleoside phosphorylase